MADLVATWQVTLGDGIHKIEFEHGTISGKRVVRVDGKEVLRKEWMFKLVGKEHFNVGKAKCTIGIEATSGFMYEYSIEVNGKPLEKFSENQSKIMCSWLTDVTGEDTRITLGSSRSLQTSSLKDDLLFVLEKDTLDVWVNGQKVPTTGEFVDDGTETHFTIGRYPAFIKATSSGKRKTGILHQLFINGKLIPPERDSYA